MTKYSQTKLSTVIKILENSLEIKKNKTLWEMLYFYFCINSR